MKINHKLLTPPHVCIACVLALSLAFSFTSCSDGSSGSDDNGEQITNPADNSSNSNSSDTDGSGNSGTSGGNGNSGSNTNPSPSTPETPKTYTITYELDGGTNAESNPSSYTSETETITLLNPSRGEYFDFGGWYTDSEFSDSSKKTEIAKGSTGNITLYAKWTVAAENAASAINSFPAGEYKIAVTGQMTTDSLNSVMAAIKGNSNSVKVYLDLGGIAIDIANWQTGMTNGNMSRYNDNLTGIVIPPVELPEGYSNSLLIDSMFIECKNLKSVIILNSSDEYKIDYYAFKDCTSLEYVEIPASIVSIYSDAFDGCTALETITYKGTVEQWKQVKTDSKNAKYKLMSLNVQCENGTASGSDLTEE